MTEKNQYKEPTKILNVMFLSIFFANMALNMGQQLSNSTLSLYAKSFNTPASQIGQLMSMFAYTALIFRFVAGPAMNSFNKKYLLAIAMGFMTVSYLGFANTLAISDITGLQPINVLKIFRLLQGVGNAFGNSCCLTIASETLPKKDFTKGMGYYSIAQVISQALGPTIGVELRNAIGYSNTYFISAIVMVFAILAALAIQLPKKETQPFKMKLENIIVKPAIPTSAINFFLQIGFTSINSFLLVYAEERGIERASLFFTVQAFVLLVSRPFIAGLNDKYGFVKIGIPCSLITAVSLCLIGIAPNLTVLLLASLINAFGFGAIQPMIQALTMKSVDSSQRGSAASMNYIAMDGATIIGPYICGVVADIYGYVPLMWFVMALFIVAAAFSIMLFKNKIEAIESNF